MQLEKFTYDNSIVRKFAYATVLWALVGMLVGVIIAFQLAYPALNLGISLTSFGRLRPLHTNAVIFAFVGNGIYTGVYYMMPRLLKTSMWSKALGNLHFWSWQLIIVAAAVTLPLGLTQGKEYAELIWPIDIAITLVWVIFGVNMFATILTRRERHLYVAIWFIIGTWVTVALLHIVNSFALPTSLTHSYSWYAGVQDALVQWWYGHNAVAFFLTTPMLGIMYYFVPKRAERPVYSYRLSILHFWSLIFIYIWAGPHHLHYTSLPDWVQTLGMTFSIMLWMPSWGGMINGIMTLSGAWDKLRTDPVLRFLITAVAFYGMSTFEGPLMSIRAVNALSHYTDWTIGHVHSGALGWVALISFGALYHLVPILWGKKELYSLKLVNTHFWLATIGIVLYIVAMWISGITQGLMWRTYNEMGNLQYSFIDVLKASHPLYVVRALGGLFFLSGACVMAYNFYKTIKNKS